MKAIKKYFLNIISSSNVQHHSKSVFSIKKEASNPKLYWIPLRVSAFLAL